MRGTEIKFSWFKAVLLSFSSSGFPKSRGNEISRYTTSVFRCDLLDISPSLSEAAGAIVDVSFWPYHSYAVLLLCGFGMSIIIFWKIADDGIVMERI